MFETNLVRVSLQQNVAHGLQEISGVASSCLAAMRCPACTSGRSPEFATLRDAVVGAQSLAVEARAA